MRAGSIIRPCVKRFGLYSIICECRPLMGVYRFFASLLATFLTVRWLCDWCPPFVLRLRKEVTAEEEDADLEDGKDAGKEEADE